MGTKQTVVGQIELTKLPLYKLTKSKKGTICITFPLIEANGITEFKTKDGETLNRYGLELKTVITGKENEWGSHGFHVLNPPTINGKTWKESDTEERKAFKDKTNVPILGNVKDFQFVRDEESLPPPADEGSEEADDLPF